MYTPHALSSTTRNMANIKSFLLSLSLSSLLISLSAFASTTGTIERVTKQHILAVVPPGTTTGASQPFLTSPSSRYAASFVRGKTAPGAGGFGNDFCYVLVEDTSTGQSVWESECTPVSDANACTLAFTDDGLEVFDGSNSVWSTEADGDHVEELMLVDEGDMRIIAKDGELAWKASDDARANQGCGLPGSVGLAPESPPFAGPIGGGNGNGPFGQPAAAPAVNGQQQTVANNPQSAVASATTEGQQQQQQTVADNPQSAVAPAAAANGQQQQQQTVADNPQSVVAPTAADGQQQQLAGSPQSAVAPAAAADGQQQPADSPQTAVAPTINQQQQPLLGDESGQQLGFSAQPLVDNSPFDSGSVKGASGVGLAVAALLLQGLLL